MARLGPSVFDVTECQIELKIMAVSLAAVFGATVGRNSKHWSAVKIKEGHDLR
jgi:hypothetical protein